jgi:hypothetical protein
MLLFFTRDARFRFSRDGRFDAEYGESGSYGAWFSELLGKGEPDSRPCQKRRGEEETSKLEASLFLMVLVF